MKNCLVGILIIASQATFANETVKCAYWNKASDLLEICAKVTEMDDNIHFSEPKFKVVINEEGYLVKPTFVSVESRAFLTKRMTGERICKRFKFGKYIRGTIIEREEFNDGHLNLTASYVIKEMRCFK